MRKKNPVKKSSTPLTARWTRGYEYEFAYCSNCGRMQWAGWYTNSQADEKIGDFNLDYEYCPTCGARMIGTEHE